MAKGKRIFASAIALIICIALIFGVCSMTACSSDENIFYTVNYNLNYEGGATRTVQLQSGRLITKWQPYREGYTLDDWYCEADSTTPFDFSEPINSDVNLYAKWNIARGSHAVTFNGNYNGAGDDKVISVKDGEMIPEDKIPSFDRLGFQLEGWYSDPELTEMWDFAADEVTEDITLYAKYNRDNSVQLDADGNVIYENTYVNAWVAVDFGYYSVMEEIADEFNELYDGKIIVNLSRTFSTQDELSLRFQQTPEKNRTNYNYYAVSDAYDLAGIDYSVSDWYEGAAKDSIVENKLYSVPVVASVPYLIYNKEQMARYNPSGEMPTNYTEFSALLDKVYEGEISSNSAFKSFRTGTTWTFTEYPSGAAFIQNGADYFSYTNGVCSNNWSEPEYFERATTALQNTYDIFGAYGAHHGTAVADSGDGDSVKQVSSGNAFMSLVNWAQANEVVAENSDKIGVLPISGLFSDDEIFKDRIPVHSVGFAFYKAAYVTNTQLAAAAVFAQYVSEQAYRFAETGWYPLLKSAANNQEFTQSENAVAQLLRKVGDPDNFYTFDGVTNGKAIVSDVMANMFIVPALSGSGKDLATMIKNAIPEIKIKVVQ